MTKRRNPGERLQGDSWYFSPFYIIPVFEKGMKSVEEKHRGFMAVTEVGISKGCGLSICRVIFKVETCGPESTWMAHDGFQRLVGTEWEHRKWQWLFSWAGCSEDSSAPAIAVLEVLMKVMAGDSTNGEDGRDGSLGGEPAA